MDDILVEITTRDTLEMGHTLEAGAHCPIATAFMGKAKCEDLLHETIPLGISRKGLRPPSGESELLITHSNGAFICQCERLWTISEIRSAIREFINKKIVESDKRCCRLTR